MRPLSAGHRPLSAWRGAWCERFRRCERCCSTIATPSGPLTDTGCRVLLGNGAEQRTYCLNRPLRRRPVRVVLDAQLSGEYLGEVDLDSGANGEIQLTVGADYLHIWRRPYGRDQTVIGKQDDIGQARRIADVLRAEVKSRLLDHALGEVRLKSLCDVAGEVDHTGLAIDLGEIGRQSHRIGAPRRGHRR